jgi:hypothetical protein
LADAYTQREELTRDIATVRDQATSTEYRYQRWDRGFILKKIRKEAFAALKDAAATSAAELAELQEQLRLTTLSTEITVDPDQAEPYSRMKDAFASLSRSEKIWNFVAERRVDQAAERSPVAKIIRRDPVAFSLDACDLIEWTQNVPHCRIFTGGDIYIYPGFILYRASRQAFALIDCRDVSVMFSSTEFVETESIPSDTQIVDYAWARANTDGTPDRRFVQNYQIPVTKYGLLRFTSPSGLDVRYVCSNSPVAEAFAQSWTALQLSFDDDLRAFQKRSPADIGLNPGEAWKEAFYAVKAIFAVLEAAMARISSRFIDYVNEGHPDCVYPTLRADVTYFMRCLRAMIRADRHFEATATVAPPDSRSTFLRVIETVEERCATFDLSEDPITAETSRMCLDCASTLIEAQVQFQGISADAFLRSGL